MTMGERHDLEKTIAALEARLEELQRRLPAHSIPPAMVAELDELDQELERARARLAELERSLRE
jgi:chromosome segregation ATPase